MASLKAHVHGDASQKGWLRRVEIGSPTVAHELAITTADEKRFAIFSRVVMPHGGTMMHENGPELACAKVRM
jgi:hypothetical protein